MKNISFLLLFFQTNKLSFHPLTGNEEQLVMESLRDTIVSAMNVNDGPVEKVALFVQKLHLKKTSFNL